jgi:hypothetical protein
MIDDYPNDCITFGESSQGRVLGFDKIAIITEHSISKVLLVESLDYNLLSVSQLCEMGYIGVFYTGKNRLVKITYSSPEVVLRTTKHTVIYPNSGPSLEAIAQHPVA